MIEIAVRVAVDQAGVLVAPVGLSSPAGRCLDVTVDGARQEVLEEATLGQRVLVLTPTAEAVTLRYAYDAVPAAYPEPMFVPHRSRYIDPTPALASEAREIVAARGVAGFVDHVTRLFEYGHTVEKFYEGAEAIPQLCDMVTGSCVDINTYLVSGLRAAGVAAGYVTGYFIPAEKRTSTTDMHCWVATRVDGVVAHWDIAHHLKMGTRNVAPGLNPKPGVRLALSHSMGWTVPSLGVEDVKLLTEPMWHSGDGWARAALDISLTGYDLLDAAQNAAALAD
ncbi:MAG: transglutaminase family protein [Pseudomonadota bacterium]